MEFVPLPEITGYETDFEVIIFVCIVGACVAEPFVGDVVQGGAGYLDTADVETKHREC